MFSLQDIQTFLDAEVVGTADNRSVLRPAEISDSDESSIVWLKRGVMNYRDLVHNTRALGIICMTILKLIRWLGKCSLK